jgi:hypothetical protein
MFCLEGLSPSASCAFSWRTIPKLLETGRGVYAGSTEACQCLNLCPQPQPGQGKSGRGLPQCKTLRDHRGRWQLRQGLDCASPLALCPSVHARQSGTRTMRSGTLCKAGSCMIPSETWKRSRHSERETNLIPACLCVGRPFSIRFRLVAPSSWVYPRSDRGPRRRV